MPRHHAIALLVVLGLASVHAVAAATWMPLGPSVGEVRHLRYDPRDARGAYAGTSIGVFRSTNGGFSWLPPGTGAPSAQVSALAVDPRASRLVWAAFTTGFSGVGVFRSTDGGQTWADVSGPIGSAYVNDLAVHPHRSGTVLAATDNGLYGTDDGGATWHASLSGDVGSAAFHTTRPDTIYAGVQFDGPYRSTDGGASWQSMAGGYTGSKLFYDIVVHPTRGDSVYTCGWDVFWSADAGQTWTELTNGLPSFVICQSMDVAQPAALSAPVLAIADLGGFVYLSTDGGASFANVAPPPPPGVLVEYEAVALAPGKPQRMLAGALGGEVLRTQDAGGSWSPSTAGLAQGATSAVAAGAGALLAGTHRGVYVSSNQGASWSYTSVLGDIGATVNDLAMRSDGQGAFAAVTDAFFEGNVFRAAPPFLSWSIAYHTDGPATALAVDPARPDTIIAGYTWDILPGHLAISHDGGTSWFERPVGQAGVYATHVPVGAAPGVAYAGTDSRFLRTTDGGLTWESRGLAGEFVEDIASAPGAPATLFAATTTSGVQRSDDEGATWVPWNDSLPSTDVRAVLVEGTRVLCGTATLGVFSRPLDGSADWSRYPNATQPSVPLIRDLAVDGQGNVLCATEGAAIWRTPLTARPGGKTQVTLSSTSNGGSGPWVASRRAAGGGMAFEITGAGDAPYVLRVLDVAGRLRWSRAGRTDDGGRATERWADPGAASGMYVYRAEIGGRAVDGRFVHVR